MTKKKEKPGIKSQNSRKKWFGVVAVLFSLLLMLIGGEILARLFWKGNLNLASDEKSMVYDFDEKLGWFPKPDLTKEFTGSRSVSVQNNSAGFRDISHGPKTKKRMAFVGDSFVWGYDVEQNERFTEKLRPKMPDWDILNLGVSGYGTDQELMLLQREMDIYKPDYVCLFYCDNDWDDNAANMRYNYFKPYYELVGDQLIQKGIPVNKSLSYFVAKYPLLYKSRLVELISKSFLEMKNPYIELDENPTINLLLEVKKYVESKGATFILAYVNDTTPEQKMGFCNQYKINYLLVANEYKYPTMGEHWTPEGHEYVAAQLMNYFTVHGVVPGGSAQSGGTTPPVNGQ